jgi:hypothetical protein
MPISDNYVVEYLLHGTGARNAPILWRRTKSQGYVTRINGIRVEFENILMRAGSRCCVTFTCATQRVHIAEPLNVGFFRAKYESEDEQNLAQLIQELGRAIERQCATQRKANAEAADSIRESIYHRLLSAPVTESSG